MTHAMHSQAARCRWLRRCAGAGAAWLLLGTPQAEATLVSVAFEGTITEVSGSVPGAPLVGSPFSGTVRYDGDQPPVDLQPPFVDVFDFTDGSAALTITLAGTTYATETSAPDVEMFQQLLTVDRNDPDQPVDPAHPDAALRADFSMPSSANVDVGGGEYDIVLGWRQFPVSIDELPLPPQPSAALAQALLSLEAGTASVSFASGASFVGKITFAIPEPATALLLGGGLLVLSHRQRRRAA